MRKVSILGFFASLALVIGYHCTKTHPATDVSKIKLNLPAIPYQYGVGAKPFGSGFALYEDGNIVNDHKATIGRVLFYDKALSLHNNVACASCHLQKNAFADPVSFSEGFNGEKTLRNTIAIGNLFDERKIGYFWDVRETSIESMVLKPVANHIEMGFERADLMYEKINNLPYYKSLFKDAYGDEKATTKRIEECLGHFLFSIVSNNSRFDQGVVNNFSNFTQEENKGRNLFVNSGCSNCHLVTSSRSFPTGYGSSTSNTLGNNGLDQTDQDAGKDHTFKNPRLKNVALTAPYMHDGRFKTLEEVIEHYSTNIQNNPNLSPQLKVGGAPVQFDFTTEEKAELIAFLKTLTDEAITTDVRFSSPFK